MPNLRIELNPKGVDELLKKASVPVLEEIANKIAGAAGPGHEVQTFVGRSRARVTVRTETDAARLAEAVDRNLTRAVDAGRI